jgi:hypothetical protein
MKLPRRTEIFTVQLTMRGGAVIEKDFFEFAWTYNNGGGISELTWREVQGTFWVDITEISAINVVGSQTQLLWREKDARSKK